MKHKVVSGFDFTMPLDGAVRIRNYRQTFVLRSQLTIDNLQRISDLQLYVHTLTHIDLLPRIPWENESLQHLLVENDDLRNSLHNPGQSLRFRQNVSVPCTIVSLAEMARMMRHKCEEHWPDSRLPTSPLDRWSKTDFCSLLRSLRIHKKRIAATVIRPGDFVIFYTGWRQFAPRDGDLTHGSWYPWHPFLMNPYLDDEAIALLLDDADGLAARGIGCDIGTLDCPLRHFVSHQESVQNPAWRDWVYFIEECQKSDEFSCSDRLPKPWDFHSVHIRTLSRLRLLVEQLHVPADLLHEFREAPKDGFPTLAGRLILMPYACNRFTDAILVSAFFTKEA